MISCEAESDWISGCVRRIVSSEYRFGLAVLLSLFLSFSQGSITRMPGEYRWKKERVNCRFRGEIEIPGPGKGRCGTGRWEAPVEDVCGKGRRLARCSIRSRAINGFAALQALAQGMVIVNEDGDDDDVDPPVRLVGECFPEWWACRRKVGGEYPERGRAGARGKARGPRARAGGMLRWRAGITPGGLKGGKEKDFQMEGGTHTPR